MSCSYVLTLVDYWVVVQVVAGLMHCHLQVNWLLVRVSRIDAIEIVIMN